jgi:hypothetical protein
MKSTSGATKVLEKIAVTVTLSVGGSGGGGGGEHVNCAGSWARFLEHEDTGK